MSRRRRRLPNFAAEASRMPIKMAEARRVFLYARQTHDAPMGLYTGVEAMRTGHYVGTTWSSRNTYHERSDIRHAAQFLSLAAK